MLIIASVINGTVDNLDGQMFAGSSAGLNVKAIIGVAALSPFYFIGFDVIPQAAEEINVPAKKIGSILILSVVLAVVFYALVIVAVGLVMGPQAIIDSEQATGLVTADAMAAAFNTKIMAKVIIVGGMCGIVTSWNSFLLGGLACHVLNGRVIYDSEVFCKASSKAQDTYQCTDSHRISHNACTFCRQKDACMD